MNDKLHKASLFDVEIGGVVFTLRRRSTGLMLKIGDVRRVFTLLAKQPDDALNENNVTEATQAYYELQQGVIRHALVAVDGVPFDPSEATVEELEPFSDALFKAFMRSGLDVDFTPDS